MVSSFYSEAAFVTGVTHTMIFAKPHEKRMKFIFKLLEIMVR